MSSSAADRAVGMSPRKVWEAVKRDVRVVLSAFPEASDVEEADAAVSLEALRIAIAKGSATPAALCPTAIEIYAGALGGCCPTLPSFTLAATTCAANVVFAAATQGDCAFVAAFAERGAPTAVDRCRAALPALAYVALVKIVHLVSAMSNVKTLCIDDTLVTALHWVFEMQDERLVEDENEGTQISTDFLGSVAGAAAKGRDKERLAKEILSAYYALSTNDASSMLEDGMLIAAIRRLVSKHSATTELLELQVGGVRLIMLAPSFSPYDNAVFVEKVLFLLQVQLWRYLVEGAIDAPDLDVAPLLDVARKLHRASSSDWVQRIVFPREDDTAWRGEVDDQRTDQITQAKADLTTRGVPPVDAPPFTLRALLFSLQTDAHDIVRRFANEFLFDLCNRDVTEFTARCGIGNAVAFLGSCDAPP
eukprot:CAMPEP_0118899046 /NCGR_PEP_ID=MMETSP1166-20130328/5774_1 /TAXON_ID=1104430 /ORGANISM="Chrysoreinhardia sp, Strain CCMP3193" /LENGTH=420 /DNA_ID=CAMNT_0006838167 /DNA_START=18 /DNA_END=1280 /DNA_ORIENTATION=-